jgi:hypothetical protein
MPVATVKLNPKIVREKARARGIDSIAELARRIGKTRPAIYFALENPKRFPLVYRDIIAAIK